MDTTATSPINTFFQMHFNVCSCPFYGSICHSVPAYFNRFLSAIKVFGLPLKCFFRFKVICFRMLHYYLAIVGPTIIFDPLFATHAGYIIGNQLAFLSTSIYCIQAASHVGIFCYKHILSYSSWDCYSIRFAIYIWQMKGARKTFIVLLFIIPYLCIQPSIWYLYILIKLIYSYPFVPVFR